MKMTIKNNLIVVAAAGLLAVSSLSFGQSSDQAATLDQLLEMVKNSKIDQSQEHKKREAEFRRERSKQASLLAKAESTKKQEEARSAALEQKYKDQDVLVQAKRQQLDERMGSLKELFGHLTSTAGDLRSNIDSSIVSAQYSNRTDFLVELIDKMNSETKLPTIEEIERLWYEMQKETVESGKVVKFTAAISNPAGDVSEQEVVRIGNYNLVSNGKYLVFREGKLSELVRQPKGALLSQVSSLQSATTGFSKVGVDPTGPAGGSLLSALINSPSLEERWHQGGLVGYIITGVFAFAIALSIWRFFALSGISSKVGSQLKNAKTASTKNPLGRILKVAEDNPGASTESLELKLEEAILKERPPIESGLNLLKIISMVAPLMGLLGTVVGMIVTFQAITIFGAGDPKAMAGGISGALVTTVLGLCVAIPTVLLHTFLNSKAKRILHILEEQSAGIIAVKSER